MRKQCASYLLVTLFLATPLYAASPDVEERRITLAHAANADMVTRYQSFADEMAEGLTMANTQALRATLVARIAHALWREAVADGASGYADDRALYWGRLALRVSLRRALPPEHTAELETLLTRLESYSRGFEDIRYPDDATHRILITGFDPFQLDQDITQSNPSGLAALLLDGSTVTAGTVRATIVATVMPVRFEDFDRGIIEDFLTPHFRTDNLALMVTISMGRSGFDLERFPGLRRSATASDNQNVITGANENNPLVPHLGEGLLDGPEFVEFSLPAHAMLDAAGTWPTVDNRQVRTLERGSFAAASLAELVDQTAVSGSGGGYLSNEISYRSILLHQRLLADFPIGHIHTPRIAGFDEAQERQIVEQIQRLLIRAIE
ncbi:MAG: hypothetical protein O7G86_20020 [Gammaproteobacteria bacterium]|nr:hypothetical protein [Gammaproteobacteria bacterium]